LALSQKQAASHWQDKAPSSWPLALSQKNQTTIKSLALALKLLAFVFWQRASIRTLQTSEAVKHYAARAAAVHKYF
jgi:hypothetical protein